MNLGNKRRAERAVIDKEVALSLGNFRFSYGVLYLRWPLIHDRQHPIFETLHLEQLR